MDTSLRDIFTTINASTFLIGLVIGTFSTLIGSLLNNFYSRGTEIRKIRLATAAKLQEMRMAKFIESESEAIGGISVRLAKLTDTIERAVHNVKRIQRSSGQTQE